MIRFIAQLTYGIGWEIIALIAIKIGAIIIRNIWTNPKYDLK